MEIVSVIIPIYNVEPYLKKCVKSICNQTYSNLEIFLVNDGSPDNCGKIAEALAAKDHRIQVIHKQNGGLSSARNAALEKASGEYIVFVDPDDWIELNMIEAMVHEMEINGADLVVCDYNKVYENKVERQFLKIKPEIIDLQVIGRKRYLYEYIFNYRHGDEVCNKIYKSKILKEYNLIFEPNKNVFSEDKLFNMKYLMHINKIVSINNAFYNYLQREGSLIQQPKPNIVKQYLVLAEKYLEYLDKNDVNIKSVYPIIVFHLLISSLINFSKVNTSLSQIRLAIEESQKTEVTRLIRKLLKEREVNEYCRASKRKLLTPLLVKVYAVLYTLKINSVLALLLKIISR